ncbi:MAG: nonribosomal peptide synthetase MxaA [Methylococcales bacterium]|nr:nonribosomal peptide synthetase MxaA [Methylococcales bacterium]
MRILFVLFLFVLGCSSSVDEPIRYFKVETPRPFGYVNGDEISQRILFETRPGISLERASLPGKGPLNRWLNLNDIRVSQADDQHYQIDLRYQIFYAPLEVKALTLPSFELQLNQGEQRLSQTVPAWTFTLSPLRELVVRQTEQGEYMRPDSLPPLLNTRPALYGLLASVLIALALAVALAWQYGYLAFNGRRRLFKKALRTVSGISKSDMATGLQALHHCLNTLNGQPLFVHQLADFYQRHPHYQSLHAQWLWFFNYSNRFYFSPGMTVVSGDIQQLKTLCQLARSIERGSR